MAFAHGSTAAIWLGSIDLSGYSRSLALKANVDTSDSTVFGSTWKSSLPGMVSSTVEVGGLYDPGLTSVRSLLESSDAVLTTGPAGLAAVGDRARLFLATEKSYAESAPVGDLVAWTASIEADGTVGLGNVLHPLGAETATGNGTAFNGGAATAAGLVAHLHVTAVSGTNTPTVTVKLQDSTNGSTGWLDITSAAFTAATGITSQRITTSGAVRQYVRAVWTISGTNPSLTFGVAFARL